MSHKSVCNLTLPRKIKKSSVYKAIELIAKHKIESKKKSRTNEEILNRKIAYYCKRFEDNKKRKILTVFTKSLALLEMQSYITRQDWKHALHLFYKLLEYPSELEPVVWRYMFIILLHINDPLHLCKFFQQCISSSNRDNGALLERLLLLPFKK